MDEETPAFALYFKTYLWRVGVKHKTQARLNSTWSSFKPEKNGYLDGTRRLLSWSAEAGGEERAVLKEG
jgi:hypothetical protein